MSILQDFERVIIRMLIWPWSDPRSTSRSRGDDRQPPSGAFCFIVWPWTL